MKYSKTIDTITALENLLLKESKQQQLNNDDEFFLKHFELEIAKSLIQDFDDTMALRIGKILLGTCETDTY